MGRWDEYAYVGPVLIVLNTMPELALPVTEARTGEIYEPREVWIEVLHTWVRLNGEWISGWDNQAHFGFRPNWLNRWKIGRAARRWELAQALPAPEQPASIGEITREK